MKYADVRRGIFIKRENRFIAICSLDGETLRVHVPNTGRCAEIFRPGAAVYLAPAPEGSVRATGWTLVSAEKQGVLFNLDSQMPNRVFNEAIACGEIQLPRLGSILEICREVRFGSSRLDFYMRGELGEAFCEVKGVTLEENGVAMFPDAPTLRGVRHLDELCRAAENGYHAFAVFILQFSGAKFFTPNRGTHPEFADAVERAVRCGITPLAFECDVTPCEIRCKRAVSVEI